jgi:hypothetical protein
MKLLFSFSFLLLLPLSLMAAPSVWPNGENPGGSFSVYFQNLGSITCGTWEVLIGVSTGTTTYMRPVCRTVPVSSDSWTLSGNTANPTSYIGTNNDQSLFFRTNATSDTRNKMIITSSGAVGIWTSAPISPLHVEWTITTSSGLFVSSTRTYLPYAPTGINYLRWDS